MGRQLFVAADVEANAEDLYTALTTADGLASFWTPQVTADGQELRFGFEAAPVDLEIRVAETTPGERVVWASRGPWPYWAGTEITWRLRPGEAGCQVLLSHTGWADDYPDEELGAVTYTWATVLQALKGYAETGRAQPALS